MVRKTRDGESTKEAVLNAAKQVFAEKGFAGSSLAMISQRCGISDGLILHHFKSKENLYHLVLDDLASQYARMISQAWKRAGNTQQAVQEMLRATFQYWSEDDVYDRISLWTYLENRTELIDEEAKLTAGLAAVIQRMQAEGKVDDRFSPYVLLTMTVGPIHFWIRYRELFKRALNLDGTLEELNRVFQEQYIQLIQKIYQPRKDLP